MEHVITTGQRWYQALRHNFASPFIRFRAIWRGRVAVGRLERLDDRLLADLGITRSDVEWTRSRPPWEDYEAMLYQRVRSRDEQRRT